MPHGLPFSRRCPDLARSALRGGPRRNFQSFSTLNFLAELSWHISEKGEHLVRHYGWYSHRQRGIQAKRQKLEGSEAATVPIDRLAVTAEQPIDADPRFGSVST